MFEPNSESGPGRETTPPAQTHQGLAELEPWTASAAPPRRASSFGLAAIAEVLEVAALALLMFIAVRTVAQNFIVDGASMEPSFEHGQLLIVNKLAYDSFNLSWLPWTDNEDWTPFGDPQQGDVVVFRFPFDPDRDFIKRIIALPGQTVEVVDGQVFVEGALLDEPYLFEETLYNFGPATVPEGEVFVLGDNRNNSYDSHSWGMLDEDLIIGRAELRYWPFSAAGRIEHYHSVLMPREVLSSR
jgi:signal peptidase I